MPLENIYHFVRISDRIATAGQPTAAQIRAIGQAGFEVVINLALPTSDNALPNERELVEAAGMRYTHIPVIWEHPTPDDWHRFLQVMDAVEGQRVFVHCAANMRVAVFMALYRIVRQGWGVEAALEKIHQIWVPNAVWQGFMAQILKQ